MRRLKEERERTLTGSQEDRKEAVKMSSALRDQELWAHLIIHGLQHLQVRVIDAAVIVQTLKLQSDNGTHEESTPPNTRKAPLSSCSICSAREGSVEMQALPLWQAAGSPHDWDLQVRHMYGETQHTASGEHPMFRRKLLVAQL